MNIETITSNAKKFLGKSFVFKYDGIDETMREYFVIDDIEEIYSFKRCVEKIYSKDLKAEIFIHTYPLQEIENKTNIYIDNIWIKTTLSLDAIEEIFLLFQDIEPSLIDYLAEEELENVVELTNDGCISERLDEILSVKNSERVVSVYWD